MKFRRLGNKILLAMMAVIFVISTSFLIYFVWYVGNLLEARSDQAGMVLIRNLAHSAELGVLTEEEQFLRGPFDGVMSDPNVVYVAAYDKQGDIIKVSSRANGDFEVPQQLLRRLLSTRVPIQQKWVSDEQGGMIDFYAPISLAAPSLDMVEGIDEAGGESLQVERIVGFVRIGISENDIVIARRRVILFGISVSLLVFVITTVFVVLFSRRITRPLAELRQGASRVAQGDLDFQIRPKSSDEVGALANSFNKMTRELLKTTVSKNYVDNIFGSMIETLVVIDVEGIIQTVNPALLRLLGYRKSDLIGKEFTKLLADERVLERREWIAFLQTGILQDFEIHYMTKGGEKIPVNFGGSIMFDGQRNARLIVGVARDAREVKRLMNDLERRRDETEQARDSAEREQRRLMSLLFSISEGVVMFDSEGAVVVVNPSARKLLRLERNINVTRQLLRSISWLHVDELLDEVLANTERSLVREVEVDFPVPQVIRISISRVSTGDGRELGLVMVLHDVTEERTIDRMRDDFVATVSHDLRSPLTTIKGFISLLLDGRVGEINEKQREFLKNVEEGADHLHKLIDDLLDLSRIKEGKLVVSVERMNVCDVVCEAVHLNKPAAENKHLTLEATLPDKQCVADMDFDRMREALGNLIHNAIKFTPEGGSIEVAVTSDDQECIIKVRDTGIGIAKEYQEAIFDKFRSVSGQMNGTSLSTGLGLSIVKGIVEAHKGRVWVESEEGKGATFIIAIPLHAERVG